MLGVALGAEAGAVLYLLFAYAAKREKPVRSTVQVIVLFGTAFLLMAAESFAKPYVAVSGLLAVTAMACVLKRKADPSVSARLSSKCGKLWIGAETVLFVLVGAAVDIRCTLTAGIPAVLMIFAALVFRCAGVWLCCIAYLQKATVKEAIGSLPLAMGLPCGNIVLSAAVLAILLTSPLGAVGIDRCCGILLEQEQA